MSRSICLSILRLLVSNNCFDLLQNGLVGSLKFCLLLAALQPYQDEGYQPIYFVCESFCDMRDLLLRYVRNMKKPFTVAYDPFTESIKILNRENPDNIAALSRTVADSVQTLNEAIGQAFNLS